MKWISILFLLLPSLALSAGNEIINTMPPNSPNLFYPQLQNFLKRETPNVLHRYVDSDFVHSGGLHGTSNSCVSESFDVEGFTNSGNRVTANGSGGQVSINYALANIGGNCQQDVCWVVASPNEVPTLPSSNYQRVGQSHIYVNCSSDSEPAKVTDTVKLMKVTLANGIISSVVDMRKPASYARSGVFDVTDPLYGGVCNGVADDNTALHNVVSAASSIARGGVVYIPEGICTLSASLTIPRGVSITGSSSSGQAAFFEWPENVYPSVIKWTGSRGGFMFNFADHWADRIENITLDGGGLAGFILYMDRSPRGALVKNVVLRRTNTIPSGTAAIFIPYRAANLADNLFPASLNYFERIFVIDNYQKALLLEGTSNSCIGCHLTSAGDDAVVISNPPDLPAGNGPDDNIFVGGYIAGPANASAVVLNYNGLPSGGFLNNFISLALISGSGGRAVYANSNGGMSYCFGCYVVCCGTPYESTDGLGQFKFVGSMFPTTSGQDANYIITPTGSPFTYTNTKPYTIEVHFWSSSVGDISDVQYGRNGGFNSIGFAGGVTGRSVLLEPGDALKFFYTVAPNINATPHN